jgi:hypothetical protein
MHKHEYCCNIAMESSHTHSRFNKERIQLCCMVWFVVSEKQGKQELLHHYRYIMDIADQIASQE